MENIDGILKEKEYRRLNANRILEGFRGSDFVKVEFNSSGDNVLLTFKSLNGQFSTLQLVRCFAFTDLGAIRSKVNEVIIKEVGHFYREHCKVRGIDFRFCYQIEVYPVNYKEVTNDEIEYNTFFAVCDDVEIQTSLEKEADFLQVW